LDNLLNKLNPIKNIYISVIVPILAIFTALILSSVVIILSGSNPLLAYLALAEGAFGNLNNWIETILKTTPLIIGGLGVALAFRGGLFNIGVEGQIFVGSIASVIIGTTLKAPAIIHIPLTLLAGVIAGAVWAAIPGYLKAKFGAHEVITTIMTNYIATRIITWSIGMNGPLRKTTSFVPETNSLLETARLPIMISDTRLHIGIVIALILAIVVYILLFRTTLGIEIRTVGLNITAAKYCGIKVNRNIVLTMAISGGLAGLAGAIQVTAVYHRLIPSISSGYGFMGLMIAMLINYQAIWLAPIALFFAALNIGGIQLPIVLKLDSSLTGVLQGSLVLFVMISQGVKQLFLRKKLE